MKMKRLVRMANVRLSAQRKITNKRAIVIAATTRLPRPGINKSGGRLEMTGSKSSGPDHRRPGRASKKGSRSRGRSRSTRRVIRSRSALKKTRDGAKSDGRSAPAVRPNRSAHGKPSRRQRGRGKEKEGQGQRGKGKEKKLLATENASEAYSKYKQMFEDLLKEMDKDKSDSTWMGLGLSESDSTWSGSGSCDSEESLTGDRPSSARPVIPDPDGTLMHRESIVDLHLSKEHVIPLMLPSSRPSPRSTRRNSSQSRSCGSSRGSSHSKETALITNSRKNSSPSRSHGSSQGSRRARERSKVLGEDPLPNAGRKAHAPASRSSSHGRSKSPQAHPVTAEKAEFALVPRLNSRSNRRNGSRSISRSRSRLFGRLKRVAGMVKTKCLPAGVHTYKLGERARYQLSNCKVPESLLSCVDLETCTIEVEIVAVHIDAVLEMPYYTIKLPDKTRKNTTGDNLMSISEFEQASMEDIWRSSSSRSRSTSRSRQRVRSSSRGRFRWRSLSRGKESGSPARGRSKSNSSTRSIRCSNGDVIVPHVHSGSQSKSPVPRQALPSTARISPAPNKLRERSPSPFRRDLSCSKFLFFDEELDVNFFPVGESPGTAQF